MGVMSTKLTQMHIAIRFDDNIHGFLSNLFLLAMHVDDFLLLEVEHAHHAVVETRQDGRAFRVNLRMRTTQTGHVRRYTIND